jgi:hypothetical protein
MVTNVCHLAYETIIEILPIISPWTRDCESYLANPGRTEIGMLQGFPSFMPIVICYFSLWYDRWNPSHQCSADVCSNRQAHSVKQDSERVWPPFIYIGSAVILGYEVVDHSLAIVAGGSSTRTVTIGNVIGPASKYHSMDAGFLF